MAKISDIKIPEIAKKIKLKRFLEKEAGIIITTYKRLLSVKRGHRNDNAPSNAKKTIIRKGKNHWMVATGETKKKGFDSKVSKRGSGRYNLMVFASGKKHSGKYVYGGSVLQGKSKPTYRSIFRWNNTADGRYSGVFGDKLPVNSKFPERLSKEVGKQTLALIKKSFPKNIDIKIG